MIVAVIAANIDHSAVVQGDRMNGAFLMNTASSAKQAAVMRESLRTSPIRSR